MDLKHFSMHIFIGLTRCMCALALLCHFPLNVVISVRSLIQRYCFDCNLFCCHGYWFCCESLSFEPFFFVILWMFLNLHTHGKCIKLLRVYCRGLHFFYHRSFTLSFVKNAKNSRRVIILRKQFQIFHYFAFFPFFVVCGRQFDSSFA